MKLATRFGVGVLCLTMFMAAQGFGQSTAYTTPEAQKAAAQLSQSAGPPMRAQSDTPNQQADRTTVPGYGSSSNGAVDNRPTQPIYENSAAAGGRMTPMRDVPADNSVMTGQRDNGASGSASGQQRGEIGVWLVENGGQGVRVGRLARDGAADRAGLRSGDIILQVNGSSVSSPRTAAQQIREIPIGQSANLTLMRDGGQQQMQITLTAARPGQSYEVGYGSDNENRSDRAMSSDGNNSGLAARTAKLEQQMESMTEELRQMRQQMSSMRTGGTTTPGIGSESSGAGLGTTPSTVSPAPGASTPPQSGTGSATSSAGATLNPTPATGTSSSSSLTSPSATTPSSSGSGSSGSSGTQDLFGTGSSSSSASPAGGASK